MEEEIIVVSESDFNFSTHEKFIWDRNMVYALIEEYKKRVSEFENPSYKKRRLWSKIAHAMRARGFKMLTDEMCDIKWRNLKKTFKEIYFGKRSTVKWEYYNVLKHIFEKDMSFYSNFGAAHRRLLLSKKTLNKKTLADVMEVEPDSSNSYIIDDSQEGLEEERPICKDDAEHRQSMSLVLVRSITQYLESRQSLVPGLLRLYSARTQRIFPQHGAARIDDRDTCFHDRPHALLVLSIVLAYGPETEPSDLKDMVGNLNINNIAEIESKGRHMVQLLEDVLSSDCCAHAHIGGGEEEGGTARQRWNRSKLILLLVSDTGSAITGPGQPGSFMLRRILEQSYSREEVDALCSC
uniref:Myb/SANT-like DNA-binding domain-containing protein n=1 Tax=Timema cristinae TaxID=61476 RepID=A0A7R9CBV6_TIMCR|nr:unnamed protein product [Timema cristinae]